MNIIPINSSKAWLLASRPKTLTAALSPVLVASALAMREDVLSEMPPRIWLTASLCVLFAALMQVAANFINDLYDFLRGTDGEERLGPERACAQGWITPGAMRWGIGIVLTLACSAGLGILASAMQSLDFPFSIFHFSFFISVGAACVLFAFLYTTLLSYCGGGDVLVWLFFGFVPVLGTYYVLTGALSPAAWLLGAAMGLVTDTLLVLNNYRDRDTDRTAHKRTLIVVFGERFGEGFYLWQGLAGVALAGLGLGVQALAPYIIYIILHLRAYRLMRRIRAGRALNGILGLTALNILLFALCTIAAIML
ncbi:MAG: 1,4-dihydroxy-2-naphthoate octaprenyltransferase [Bacteroidaceae bacterium]|nr:1,4-dihydroxy-2-naphthoate octaprenyltransferase [Bacteroidaceae bacterium]